MEHEAENIRLTAAEISFLWNSYIMNSKSKYMLRYAAEKAQDKDIKSVLQWAVQLTEKSLEATEKVYKSANHPIPYAFKEEDVRLDADKLYSDRLMLRILKNFTSFGISHYSLAISKIARADVREIFNQGLLDSIALLNKMDEIAIEKGIFVRYPNMNIPKTIEFAQSHSIMGAFLGHNRPMSSMEVTWVFCSCLSAGVTEAVLTGLAQTAKTERVRDFMAKGRKLLKEHIETLNGLLIKEELAIPPTYITEVLNTTDSPFSEKIALYFAVAVITEILNYYSSTKIYSLRKDIFLAVTQLSTELVMYMKDGLDILIDNGWMEEMPKSIDREDLINSK